ncbi:PIN domain-containing protein [Nitratireductor thuwali]|uniref:Ribonuclease VapC n=1 Tax=Nitratireductor thuwali TaxID=2267699 RepID=A0ABY5MGW5_9HYPH|nr:tRNA(fMet)-specific endonuclease VapC [Nitratireductor thuwali]
MKRVGIDTNVLLRMVLNDDERQRAAALALGTSLTVERPGFVSLIVLLEFYWSLASRYRQPKEQILATVRKLLRTRTLLFESFDAVVAALERANDRQVDFPDALIAEHYRASGCSHTVTFDKAAARIPGMELLS